MVTYLLSKITNLALPSYKHAVMGSWDIHDIFLVLTSVFITAALFNVVLYFGYQRKVAYLFFAGFCGFHVFKVWLKTFPPDQVLIASLDATAFDLIYWSVIFGLVSLNIFLAYYLDLHFKRLLSMAVTILSALAFFTIEEPTYIFSGLGVAIAQTCWAIRKDQSGYTLLFGLSLALLLSIAGFSGYVPFGYFMGTIILILLMMMATGVKLSRQTKEFHKATLRSTRLENQLLKKTIQPHFILNSLTSLQELIDYDPKKASQFVQDLSDEFRLFAEVSEKQLIPVRDELQLIRSYLGVMSARLDKRFELNCQNLDLEELIPPGILLTLVENGVTHGFSDRQEGEFNVKRTEDPDQVIYTVFNNGRSLKGKINEGVGLQYIRARLEESKADYQIDFGQLKNGFQTSIMMSR